MRALFLIMFMIVPLPTLAQSMKEMSNKDKIKYFFEKLSKDNMTLVDEFYHPQVDFVDPLGEIKGSEKIKAYYAGMYQNVKSIKFDFVEFHEAGNHVVAIWKMTLQTDKLNGGEPYSVDGNSVVKFDESGKAYYHRDYFDVGAFVYEKVPVLGYVIRKIKDRFKVE
jgi:ketosteroid isomerase-like protein